MKTINLIFILSILILTLTFQACSDKPNPTDSELLSMVQSEIGKINYDFQSCIPVDNYSWSDIKITSIQIIKKIKSGDDYYIKVSANGEGGRSEVISYGQWGPKMKSLGKGQFTGKELLIKIHKYKDLWIYEVLKCPYINPMGSEW